VFPVLVVEKVKENNSPILMKAVRYVALHDDMLGQVDALIEKVVSVILNALRISELI
jgi:hypothetical protein